MTDPPRPWLHRMARWLYVSAASVLVAMALVSILISQLLPLAERHPDVIMRWLSDRAGLSIQFDHINTGWTRRGPLLQFEGLNIGDGDDAVHIGQAELLVAQYAGLLPGRSFTELRLRRLHLVLERAFDGRWQVRGLPGASTDDTDPLSALGRLGELQVINARLGIRAPALGINSDIPDVDLRLRVAGARTRIALNARMQANAAPLRGIIDLDRHSGDARAYAAIHQADFSSWSSLLRLDGLMLASGSGQIDAWAQLRGYRLAALSTSVKLDQLVLQRVADTPEAEQVAFGEVHAQLHWRQQQGQWQLDAPHLRMGDAASPQVLDGLMLAGGSQQALLAARIDAGPLLAIAALSPRLPAGLRHWLKTAKPDASAREITLSGHAGGGLRGTLQVDNLHFASVGQTPGVAGLSGLIALDGHGALLDLDPDAAVQFDWPSGFGLPHHLRLAGTLGMWWDGRDDGIHLQTPALRVDADGYAADVRGGLWFHGHGRRPRIDMAATLDAAQVPVAKRFWVRSQMSREAMDWLDMALVSGTLRNGRALVSGELDNWPFDAREGQHVRGVFEAQGDLVAAKVRFQPDWPMLEGFNGPVRFFNDGFSLHGEARIGDIVLSEVSATLAHYSRSELQISSRASGDMQHWLDLLRHSPLQQSHGDVLDQLAAHGPVTSDFNMALALGRGDGPVITGEANLAGVNISEQRWALDLTDLHGPVQYDHTGFGADALKARYQDRPGRLSLRAGQSHVQTDGHAFEAELQMQLAPSALLERVPGLDWLKPHVSGPSHWRIALAMADNSGTDAAATPGLLTLESDLVGTTLLLPAPLNKPTAVPLPTRIQTQLPWDTAEVEVRLGRRLALRARSQGESSGISIAFGQDQPLPALPDNGLVVTGQVPLLDASGWAGIGAFGLTATDTTPTAPPQLDLHIEQLHLLGAEFTDVTLTTGHDDGSTRLYLDAPALAGQLHWQMTPDAPLKAEFTHLNWPQLNPDPAPDAAPGVATPAPAPASSTDPRQLPALDIHVSTLQLGDLPLGEARLRTRATVDGLEIEHFRIHGAQHTIEARGSWRGTGDAAQTQLALDVLDSRNFGQLFSNLGLGSHLRGGNGHMHLEGHWPGSPMAFTAAHLTGQMQVNLRNGQLLEVEPGAGRVLGLLSVAQLPRRLLLDFRDFFGKGFGFNELGGEIHVADGIARTNELRINGPSAKIRITGSTDLGAKTHNQTIEVSPRTGNLLTAVGAVAAGPLGAAVGAAANAMFKGPLSEVGARTYHVTGPWQDPNVEVITDAVTDVDPTEGDPNSSESGETAPLVEPLDDCAGHPPGSYHAGQDCVLTVDGIGSNFG